MSSTTAEPSVLATSRGKLILILLCAVGFLDLIDVTIVNVALPAIRDDLGFSVQELQWVPSAYLLTYGGFMLLGGRAADLLGRRRVLVAGITLFGIASLVGGFADTSDRAGGRPARAGRRRRTDDPGDPVHHHHDLHGRAGPPQGLRRLGRGRRSRLGRRRPVGRRAHGGTGMAVGHVHQPGHLRHPAPGDLRPDPRRPPGRDAAGDSTWSARSWPPEPCSLLVYTLVEAPDRGWDAARTIAGLAGTVALTASFIWVESRTRNPLVPFTIFQVRGLAAANITQFVAFAGFISMFFFLSLYMQGILGFSPIQTGLAYLPVCVVIGISAGIATALIAKVGTRSSWWPVAWSRRSGSTCSPTSGSTARTSRTSCRA